MITIYQFILKTLHAAIKPYDQDTKFEKSYWTELGLLFFVIATILGIATR